ncbi:MAG: hypothetical protein JNK58_11780 [Phycisphaerae bacterium]|nr:hypothetical protein [Phycisphaerae bacterium]
MNAPGIAQPEFLTPTSPDGGVQTAGADSADPTEDFGDTLRGRKQNRTVEAPESAAVEEAVAPEEAGRLHFKISVDYVTAYFSRGFRYEDRGFIIQPAGELGFDLYENEGFSIGGFVGIWNSFHDRATDAEENDDITDKWYEADLYAGLGGSLGRVGYSVTYLSYTSPSDAWETIDEVVFDLEYDDSSWWGDSGFSLTPSLSFAWEVGSNYTDGADTERGLYLQPGVTPAFSVENVPVVEHVELSFPMTVGLSLDEYYEDDSGEDEVFGFFSVSAEASIPLRVPSAYGRWMLSGGVQFLILGDTTSSFNDGEETAVIGKVGVTIEF